MNIFSIWVSTQEHLSSRVCQKQRRTNLSIHALISVFVIQLLENISEHTSSKHKLLWLVYVADKAGLGMTLLRTPTTVFSRQGPSYI